MFAKLTEFQVLFLRNLFIHGIEVPPKILARQYGVTYRTLCRAISGETWKHLPLEPTRLAVHEAFNRGVWR